MKTKYVVIIQCDMAKNRCSGMRCTNAFYEKTDAFENYAKDTKYISFTCGGCSGKLVSSKLANFSRWLKKYDGIEKDEVTIHLSSCMSTDNSHYDRCPNIDYIKQIINKKGYKNIVEGSIFSKKSEKLREEGIYKKYQ
ncbi:putative metal-binding protein [Methanococcus maripaludis]|uniref:Putative metal-binding protein n=1 Tax=Methanococcus maripaludis TaxID=39152 RepID=A0A7J9P701_METMI|nr:CGGC domain-containing protein [Methanococcus maripaludis]MBA2858564.1 putative metal-binding protein [Methanococcus maripaludis]